jgi:hypothetical protein
MGERATGTVLLLMLVWLSGCATGSFSGLRAQSLDSATSGCLRTPACYTQTPGEEAVLPWVSRTVEAARAATTVMRLLDEAQLAQVEALLVRCAREASDAVNQEDAVLQGRSPDREECRKVVRQEQGRDVTRAMELGQRKHEWALRCVREGVATLHPEHVGVEPRYQREPGTGVWSQLDPEQVAEWVLLGMKGRLWGSLAPDVVVHEPGNPNKVQRVYDLKFPCPADNDPSWGRYAPGQPHFPKDQGQMYQEALLSGQKLTKLVTPRGIF